LARKRQDRESFQKVFVVRPLLAWQKINMLPPLRSIKRQIRAIGSKLLNIQEGREEMPWGREDHALQVRLETEPAFLKPILDEPKIRIRIKYLLQAWHANIAPSHDIVKYNANIA
jgi:hypothetical protein